MFSAYFASNKEIISFNGDNSENEPCLRNIFKEKTIFLCDADELFPKSTWSITYLHQLFATDRYLGYTFMSRKKQSRKYLIGRYYKNDEFDWPFLLVTV